MRSSRKELVPSSSAPLLPPRPTHPPSEPTLRPPMLHGGYVQRGRCVSRACMPATLTTLLIESGAGRVVVFVVGEMSAFDAKSTHRERAPPCPTRRSPVSMPRDFLACHSGERAARPPCRYSCPRSEHCCLARQEGLHAGLILVGCCSVPSITGMAV